MINRVAHTLGTYSPYMYLIFLSQTNFSGESGIYPFLLSNCHPHIVFVNSIQKFTLTHTLDTYSSYMYLIFLSQTNFAGASGIRPSLHSNCHRHTVFVNLI